MVVVAVVVNITRTDKRQEARHMCICTYQYGQSHGHEIFGLADARALELGLCPGGFVDAEVVGPGGEHPGWFVAFFFLIKYIHIYIIVGSWSSRCWTATL